MKRFLDSGFATLLLCTVVAVAAPACGGDDDDKSDDKTTETTDAGSSADTGGTDQDTAAAQDTGSSTVDAGPAADVAVLTGCAASCAPFNSCYSTIHPEECVALCDGVATADKTKSCLEKSNHCDELSDCLGTKPKVAREFNAGKAGTQTWQRAGDFFVKTMRGSLSFSQLWTGADHWFFITRSGGYSYTQQMWESPMGEIFKDMPKNVQLVFAAWRDKDGTDNSAKHIGEIKTAVQAALAKLPAKDRWYWSKRVHFVTERLPLPSEQIGPDHASGWLGDFAKARGRFCFAVDSAQRIRTCGNVRFPPNGSTAKRKVSTLAYLARYFDFESKRDADLAAQKDTKVVSVFGKLGTPNKLVRYVQLPDKTELAKYDTMEVDLAVGCDNHDDDECAFASNMLHLAVCDAPSAVTPATDVACTQEVARWSLPDGREGRWVTDISPMLATLGDGGERKLMLWTKKQELKNTEGNVTGAVVLNYDLKLRLRNVKKKARPFALERLWGGEIGSAVKWDSSYDAAHPKVTFDVPADAKKIELYALITGHGWGTDKANCATFCKQTHAFSIGGKEFKLELDRPGTSEGCRPMVTKGMVAMQYSNWQYGRAGWCTGMDVRPYVVDITKAVKAGSKATLDYKALYKNKPYKPEKQKPAATSAFDAELQRSVYVVFSK